MSEDVEVNVNVEGELQELEDGNTYFVPVVLDEDLEPEVYEELREHISKLDKGEDFEIFALVFGEDMNPLGDIGPIELEKIEAMLEKVGSYDPETGEFEDFDFEFDSEQKEKVSAMLAGMARS